MCKLVILAAAVASIASAQARTSSSLDRACAASTKTIAHYTDGNVGETMSRMSALMLELNNDPSPVDNKVTAWSDMMAFYAQYDSKDGKSVLREFVADVCP